ncbi:nipped-B-like protein B isoform X2 [Prunus yedoensis var. nudiflora]|uniref:Nipped-B-like protein B isoform X2 n=1 Tax=Prunus yedoensis var. nudiflora TaxID=2094558 RepID=A0A314UZ45_PRUYE|nr:nipped-B-like protein B isoform X2 [Prunus yedoensis var. nudiflora]
MSSVEPDQTAIQEAIIGRFWESVEDFCGRVEIFSDDREEAEWLSMPLSDLRVLANEIMSLRAKRLLHWSL